MRNLSRITTDIYTNCAPGYSVNSLDWQGILKSRLKYFEIPLIGDTYEVPLFAFPVFASICKSTTEGNEMPHAIVAVLQTYGYYSYYKSIEAIMKDILYREYHGNKLSKIKLSDGDEYYGTRGAIFDKDFNPLCVYTWRMQKVTDEERTTKFQFVKPFLYVSSSIYLRKDDAVQKFLSGRMVNTVLQNHIYPIISHEFDRAFIKDYGRSYTPDVIICEKFPFRTVATEIPSISTTNEQLIKTVLEFKDDIWK